MCEKVIQNFDFRWDNSHFPWGLHRILDSWLHELPFLAKLDQWRDYSRLHIILLFGDVLRDHASAHVIHFKQTHGDHPGRKIPGKMGFTLLGHKDLKQVADCRKHDIHGKKSGICPYML